MDVPITQQTHKQFYFYNDTLDELNKNVEKFLATLQTQSGSNVDFIYFLQSAEYEIQKHLQTFRETLASRLHKQDYGVSQMSSLLNSLTVPEIDDLLMHFAVRLQV